MRFAEGKLRSIENHLRLFGYGRSEDGGSQLRVGEGRYALISVKEFFRLFFPQEEFDKFEEAVVELRQKARSYYGLSITRSLNHLRMGHFRRDIRDRLIGYKPDVELGSEQRMAIDKSFVVDGRYSALTSDKDFAVSFQTAEWLRDSLAHAGCIDFAPIALEYFKSLEQFLYGFLYAMHKTSKLKGRKIFIGNRPHENPYYPAGEKRRPSRQIATHRSQGRRNRNRRGAFRGWFRICLRPR